MKVVITEPALSDLEEIARWIGRDSIAEAERFSVALRGCCQELATRATLYPFAPGFEEQGIQRRLYRAYLIFFRMEPETVTVLRIVHGSSDWSKLLSLM